MNSEELAPSSLTLEEQIEQIKLERALDAALLIRQRDEARERLRDAEQFLNRFISPTGHWHGCQVIGVAAKECSQLCIELREFFGITDPARRSASPCPGAS